MDEAGKTASVRGLRQGGRHALPLLRRRLPDRRRTSRTTRSSRSTAATARPTRTGCASRAASASTTSTIPDRLTKPLIRRDDAPKTRRHRHAIRRTLLTIFREATWEEALERAAGGLKTIRDENGGEALAGFGSAKGSNEEAYLFQKLVRTGLRHQQRRSLHAAVPRLVGGGADGGRRLGRGDGTVHRRPRTPTASSSSARARREPPGRRDLLQAGGQARRQADRHGPARPGADAPRRRTCCSSSRAPTSRCSTRCCTSSSRKSSIDEQYVQATSSGFEALKAKVEGLLAGGDGRGLRHRRRDHPRGRAHSMPRPSARSSSGAWASRSTCTAPTMRAA